MNLIVEQRGCIPQPLSYFTAMCSRANVDDPFAGIIREARIVVPDYALADVELYYHSNVVTESEIKTHLSKKWKNTEVYLYLYLTEGYEDITELLSTLRPKKHKVITMHCMAGKETEQIISLANNVSIWTNETGDDW